MVESKQINMMYDIILPSLLGQSEYRNLKPVEKSIYIRELINNTLRVNEFGLTSTQLCKSLPYDSRIIRKFLEILEFTNEIYSRDIGTAKLFIHNGKAVHDLVNYTMKVGDSEYKIARLANKLGDSILIQEKSISSDQIKGCIQLPLNQYDEFLNYLLKSSKDMEARSLW